nr:CASP-like protein 4D1 [Quercus suber]XP_023926940.1 CASP-like protein 4D1 [Quercus suber]POE92467.1 casp-like protein 4d1 [Quercus suber]POF14619.1 casp-like protein 4d1 [Quercus suber]
MAPPTSSASRIVTLLLKVFNFVLLLISLIVLTTNTATAYTEVLTFKVRFNDIYAYRYMLATNVIGFAYTLLQIAFSIFHIIMGNHLISGDGGALLDFYGDKVISYLLATGAAAGFGVTVDLKETFGLFIDRSFYEKAYASASLLLLAFVCTAILSVISSYAVPKKV